MIFFLTTCACNFKLQELDMIKLQQLDITKYLGVYKLSDREESSSCSQVQKFPVEERGVQCLVVTIPSLQKVGAWLEAARSHLWPPAYLASSHPNTVPEKMDSICQSGLSFGSIQVLQPLYMEKKTEWEVQCPTQSS